MEQATGESCLEAHHALGAACGLIRMADVARWLGVRPGLAAVMIGQIAGAGLAESPARLCVRLTAHGRQAAARVVGRRRLLESILIAEHGCALEAAQVIAARLACAVPGDLIDDAARVYGEPKLSPRAGPAPAWAVAMRARLAEVGRPASDAAPARCAKGRMDA